MNSAYRNKRGILLSGWLIFMILSNVWLLYRYGAIYWDAVSHSDLALTRLIGPLVGGVIGSLVNITGVIALLRWKKWGLYLIIGTAILTLFISLLISSSLSINWLGIFGLVILWLIVGQRWDEFS